MGMRWRGWGRYGKERGGDDTRAGGSVSRPLPTLRSAALGFGLHKSKNFRGIDNGERGATGTPISPPRGRKGLGKTEDTLAGRAGELEDHGRRGSRLLVKRHGEVNEASRCLRGDRNPAARVLLWVAKAGCRHYYGECRTRTPSGASRYLWIIPLTKFIPISLGEPS